MESLADKKKRIVAALKILAKEKSVTMLGEFGQKYTPFQILIGTILSARSRDEVTAQISKQLFKRYPTAKKLANAKPVDVMKIIKRIGFYKNKTKNIIATAKIIDKEYKGRVPKEMDKLIELPGVGRKVAGCIIVYAFQNDAIPVDTHVHRLSNRLGWVKTKTPEKTEKALMELVPKKYWQVVNDYLVSHGKNICKPITPMCSRCVIKKYCKRIGVKKSK